MLKRFPSIRFIQRVLAAWLVWAAAAELSARDIFVDSRGGNDRAEGVGMETGGRRGPVRTLAKALRLAEPGDRIVLAADSGPYFEAVTLSGHRQGAAAFGPLVIEGNGVVLDGATPISNSAWLHVVDDVFRFLPERKGQQQLYLSGIPAEQIASGPQGVAKLEPEQWTLHDGWLYFRVKKGRSPQSYLARCCGLQTGITLDHVTGVEIRDLIVQGYHVDGINAFNSARQIRLLGVIVRGNARSGVSVGGSSRVALAGCVAADNGQSQVRSEDYSEVVIESSEILPNTAPAYDTAPGTLIVTEPEPVEAVLGRSRRERR